MPVLRTLALGQHVGKEDNSQATNDLQVASSMPTVTRRAYQVMSGTRTNPTLPFRRLPACFTYTPCRPAAEMQFCQHVRGV